MEKETKASIIILVGVILAIISVFSYLKYNETNGIFIGKLYSYEKFENGDVNVTLLGCGGGCNHSKVFNECWVTNEDFNRYMRKDICITYFVDNNYYVAKGIYFDVNKY